MNYGPEVTRDSYLLDFSSEYFALIPFDLFFSSIAFNVRLLHHRLLSFVSFKLPHSWSTRLTTLEQNECSTEKVCLSANTLVSSFRHFPCLRRRRYDCPGDAPFSPIPKPRQGKSKSSCYQGLRLLCSLGQPFSC